MTPNDDTRDEELLTRYRQAAADTAGPSDAARDAILAESRRVAEELAKLAPRQIIDLARPAANDSRWKITAFGTIGAALLAALLFAPRHWENPPLAEKSTASASAPEADAETKAQIEPPRLAEATSSAPSSDTAPLRSKSAGAPALNLAAPAPAAPPSVAQNYAPVPPSAAPPAANLVAAPSARLKPLDLSARAAQSNSLAMNANRAARADSALEPANLQTAVAQGDAARAATLLDQGALIDARDEAGRTPLMLAVTENRVEIVRLLLARGADPNAADNAGHTPLQQATKRNLQDVAALLQRAGAR